MDAASLPTPNAGLETLAGALLAPGFALVRRDRTGAHRRALPSGFHVPIAGVAVHRILGRMSWS